MYSRKGTCQKCIEKGDAKQIRHCLFCNTKHEIQPKDETYKCAKCNTCHHCQPSARCLDLHNKKFDQFKKCKYCNNLYALSFLCLAKQDNDKLYFKQGKIYAQQKSFVTWDIENVQDGFKNKYSMQHVPCIVTWDISYYKETENVYEHIDHFYNNDLQQKEDKGIGNYIISSQDVLLKFINHMALIEKKYKVSYFYAHNAASYDNYLLLAQIIKLTQQFDVQQTISNNKLLHLKINGMSFKDSYRIIPSPLVKLNKELDLDLEVDLYIQNGGKLKTIKQLAADKILQNKHFDKLSADEFKQYVTDYGHFDYVDQYINYCIQDSNILTKVIQKQIGVSIKEQGANIINYLTAPSMSMNLYTHECGTKIQVGFYNLKHNKSKCEYRLSQLVQTNIEMLNKLLETIFKQISNVLYNQKFLDTRYNIDIIFEADNKKYGLELDGIFYHGLKVLPKSDKYYTLMYQRKMKHEDKNAILVARKSEAELENIFHVTDIDFIQFEKDNDIKIEMPDQYYIANRQILAAGRTECFTHHQKIDKTKERMYAIDFTSLYPSCMVFGNLPLRRLVVGYQSGSESYSRYIKSVDLAKHNFRIDQEYIRQAI